ncbi:MAG TPA: DegV family protein [Pyrinomonadaceae bacterium]
MSVTRLDGLLLQRAVVAAAQRVLQMQEQLDSINVFPVPDSDTGTNMALTLRHVAEGALDCKDSSVYPMSVALAEAALAGAHGSSGSILAQFFQGLSEGLRGQEVCDLGFFVEAAARASSEARAAVSEPREGTILTVMRDWAESLSPRRETRGGFPGLLRHSLRAAEQSLKRTPSELDVLARAGVVDAGAQGFVYMLEGVVGFIRSGTVEPLARRKRTEDYIHAVAALTLADIPHRFCTQLSLAGQGFDRGVLKERLAPLGDSIIITGSGERVHVHVHANDPEVVFAALKEYGELSDCRQEDMRAQHTRARHGLQSRSITLATDSSCDLPQDEFIRRRIHVVPCLVTIGEDTYADKVTLTEREFYRLLATSDVTPKTSQPSSASFSKAYLQLSEGERTVLVLTVSGALSGTLQAAELGARAVQQDADVTVMDSRNISAGLGLIVREAADAIEAGLPLAEVRRRVDWAVANVRLFALIETTEYLIRGGRLSRFKGGVANLMNVKPILTIDHGGVQVVARTLGTARGRSKLFEIVEREAAGKRELRFMVAHANAHALGGYYVERIKKSFGVLDVPLVSISPALGSHVGPGAIGIVFLGRD